MNSGETIIPDENLQASNFRTGNPNAQAPRFLVLLASHNGSAYIRQQLESILSQRGVDVELLAGDDASIDDTADIINSFRNRQPIKLIRRVVATGSAAQNFAQLFREANSSGFDYVALSDQDDIWLPDKLQRAATMLTLHNAAGYSCSVISRWPDGREAVFRQSSRPRKADFLFEGAGQGCSFVVTARLFLKVQALFQTREDITGRLIYHDWAVYAVARALELSWVFDARPLLFYRQHGGNDTGARHTLAGLRKRFTMFANGRYKAQVSAIAMLAHEISPGNSLVRNWRGLDARSYRARTRLQKAIFALRFGRRRRVDALITAIAALVGWV